MKKKIIHIIREENFLSLAGNLVVALFGIAGFALMARSLQVSEFGQWILFLSAGSFVEMFRFGITNTGLIRFLSGADENSRKQYIGANAMIGFIATVIIVAVMILCNGCFKDAISHSGYALFFKWYPVLAFINLPWNNALVVLQADRQFGSMLLLKSINSIGFFLILLLNYGFFKMNTEQLVIALLVINALTSLISVLYRWDGFRQLRSATAHANRTLLHFGKYTTFTLVGTNLLRSADTIIISLSPLGSAAVALYSIPLKLTELQQIPLRSFVATAFPKMSKASMQGNITAVRNYFYTYSGAITYLFVLASIITFLLADWLVLALGGKQYLVTDAIPGCNVADILRVFAVYGLLLPIDRMTGIGLDAINKPSVNAIKVFYMVMANIIGDIIAIFIFKSLLLVAVASILFTLVGIYVGVRFLNRELSLSFSEIFIRGAAFYKEQVHKIFFNRNTQVVKI